MEDYKITDEIKLESAGNLEKLLTKIIEKLGEIKDVLAQ